MCLKCLATVSSGYEVAIIRTGVSRVYLEVLGGYGQRSVRMSIKFFPVCSLGQGQSEDKGCMGHRVALTLASSRYSKELALWLMVEIRNCRQ